MHLDAGAVQRHGFDLDANHLSALQLLEDPIQYAGFGPAVHARVDRVPVSEPRGQSAPLAAVLGHVQHRVQNAQIRQTDVASLRGKAVRDLLKLGLCDLHAVKFQALLGITLLVLTPPNLILEAQNLSLDSMPDFFERNVGANGDVLNTRLQRAFNEHLGPVSLEVKNMS